MTAVAEQTDILRTAREQVLERGEPLTQEQVLAVLQLPDAHLDDLLALAHDVRMRWCGPEVEIIYLFCRLIRGLKLIGLTGGAKEPVP